MRLLTLALALVSGAASAQTLPFRLPQFPEPPHLNGADGVVYPNGILYNPTLGCLAGAVAGQWPCLATDADVSAAQSAAVQQAGVNAAATYMPRTEATAATATLNARIDAVQASIPTPDTVCGTATISGLSIPLSGISTATTLTVAGAKAGSPCVVGGSSFLPLGAYAVCAVTAANTVQVRFQGGGLLGSVVSIPNGAYKACALIRP